MGGFVPDKGKRAMLTTDQINDLHHLYWVEHWSIRKIEQPSKPWLSGSDTSEHELANHQEVFAGAGPDFGGTVPRQQTGSLQAHHRRTAGEGPPRQRGRHRATTAAPRL